MSYASFTCPKTTDFIFSVTKHRRTTRAASKLELRAEFIGCCRFGYFSGVVITCD